VPQQSNDDTHFWEKFAYGFAGGLVPKLLNLAEFFNHSWSFPKWSSALGYSVAAIIYAMIGGFVSWVLSPDGLEKARLVAFGLGARYIILATLAHLQVAAPTLAYSPRYGPNNFRVQKWEAVSDREMIDLGSLKLRAATTEFIECSQIFGGHAPCGPRELGERALFLDVGGPAKVDVQRFTEALMHGLGLDPNDLGALIGLSVTVGALLVWALTWVTLVRKKDKVLNLLKSQVFTN